jgi:hypothetical protein
MQRSFDWCCRLRLHPQKASRAALAGALEGLAMTIVRKRSDRYGALRQSFTLPT